MPEAADLLAALVALLSADTAVAAMTGDRVFAGELPGSEADSMPRAALVVAASGGTSLTAGSYAEHDTSRADLFAYGATPHEAALLMAAAGLVMRRIRRAVSADVLLHWAQPAGGVIGDRDRDLAWPRCFQSFQVFHALEAVS